MSRPDRTTAETGVTAPVSLHSAKRADIVDVAAEVLYERGFSAGTTREIAAEVGLTQPAIYHYVGSKDHLLAAIAEHVDREMTAALERGVLRSVMPEGQLTGIIEEFTIAVLTNQKAFAVYYRENHHIEAGVRARVEAHEREFVRRTSKLVSDLQEGGVLPGAEPPTVIAEAILGMASWSYRWYRPGGRATPKAVARAFTRLIGMTPNDQASGPPISP